MRSNGFIDHTLKLFLVFVLDEDLEFELDVLEDGFDFRERGVDRLVGPGDSHALEQDRFLEFD